MPDPELKSISSSELPAILGCSPWSTRWLVAQRFLGNALPDRSSNYMDWGVELQPLILKNAARELAIEIDANVGDRYIRRGMFGYTADGWSNKPDVGRGVIEAKAVFNFHSWISKGDEGWDGGKKLPKHVEIQTQVQMMCGDGKQAFKWGLVAVWHQAELAYFNLTPNPEAWEAFERVGAAFLDDINKNDPGDPFGDPSEMPMIQALFAPKKGKVLDLREDPRGHPIAHQVTQFEYHKRARLLHEKGEAACKNALIALMADSEEMLLPFQITVKSRRQERKGYTAKPTAFNVISASVPEDLITAKDDDSTTDDL
jgi:hypothetical protein